VWILLLWKRYDLRDLFILNGQDGKPMVFVSEEAAKENGKSMVLSAGYSYQAVRVL
jgi:hypothetical protein